MAITQTVSTADRTSMAFIEQTAFNTVPPGNPTIADLRYASHSLGQQSELVVSPEIRGDRQTLKGKRVSVATSGDIQAPLSFESHEDFQLAAIGSLAFSSANAANTASASTVAASNLISGTGIATNVAVGDLVDINGFVNTGNNGLFKVTALPGGLDSLTVDPAPSGADETAVGGVTAQPLQKASNSTALRIFTIEEKENDLTNVFTVYIDQYVNAWAVIGDVGSLVEQTFSFLGSSMDPDNTATIGDGANTAANTNDVMGPVDEVMTIIQGVRGSSLRIDARRIEIRSEAGGRTRQNLGELSPSSIGHGTIKFTGTLTLLKEDATQLSRYANFTPDLALIYALRDVDGNIFAMDLPSIQFGDAQVPVSGQDSDRLLEIQFTGSIQADEGVMFNLHKFDAP